MHRQELSMSEKVLGREHPDTLLAKQHYFTESCALYEQACAAFTTVLGEDHPTTLLCRRYYHEMLASQERDQSTISSAMPTTDVVNIPNKKRSKLSYVLMKMGIRSSKFSL